MSIGVWTPEGTVITNVGGTTGNACILYEGSAQILSGTVFKMLYAQSGVGINYAESTDGVTFTPYASNPVIDGTPFSGFGYPKLHKEGSTYYLYITKGGTGTGIDIYTSSDMLSWVLAKSNALVPSQAWEGGQVWQFTICDVVAGTWYGYYSGAGPNWYEGLATSTDGLNWTKSVSNPIISVPTSNFDFHKIGSTYYGWSQANFHGPCRFTATNPAGPWTQLGNITYYGTIASEQLGDTTYSLADPVLVEAAGSVYMYVSVTHVGSTQYINCAKAIGMTMAQLVQTTEGVVGVPAPWYTGSPVHMVPLASDSFTGADANPIGGNWTTQSTGHAVQRLSNMATGAVSAAGGEAYWNALSWDADQWASVSVPNFTGSTSFAGVMLRANTAGTRTAYRVFLDGTGKFDVARLVNGASTNIKQITITPAPGDTVAAAIIGTTLIAYRNGGLLWIATDANIATGAAGLFDQWTTTVTNSAVDDWAGGTFAYSLGGNAGVGGATVSYSGAASGSVTADAAGNYILPTLAAGSYTITPSLTGYTFSPTNSAQTVSTADITGVDFTATPVSGGVSTQVGAFLVGI